MDKLLIQKTGVKVGLEIHQQLATNKKLFCDCKPIETEQYEIKFQRKLRGAKSELGESDSAVLFENIKSKTIIYYANSQSSCLVEQDEEPPHPINDDAKQITLMIATMLKSNIFSEIYPMRKTVVDGSNTTGFQRTMLVAHGGWYTVDHDDDVKIKIQSICLEEDAAKILGEDGNTKKYGLERLGVPLVEIATEPFDVKPQQIKNIALGLGRILRSTKKVQRGLGSIRQDVNVSIKDGGGVVIEVKGVQHLDQIEKVVEYEAKRQDGLLQISKEIQQRGWDHKKDRDIHDITSIFAQCRSKIIQEAISNKKHAVFAILFKNMAGMFKYSPYDEVRLGRDIAELVRFFGIGGVFHSDEHLSKYGIQDIDIKKLNKIMDINTKNDAFLILAAPTQKIDIVIKQIISRINYIKNNGIPVDTRLATQSGQTKFLRPRPGAARMYPETDVPPLIITQKELDDIQKKIPKSWNESILELEQKYKINLQLAEQIFDSEYIDTFEYICQKNTQKISPNYVASTLCSTLTNLERKGLKKQLLTNQIIIDVFTLLEKQEISKESIEIIFEKIMSGKKPDEVIKSIVSSSSISNRDLDLTLEKIINDNKSLVQNQKERAVGPLMGIAMKTLRGKVSGQEINKRLQEKIQKQIDGINKNEEKR